MPVQLPEIYWVKLFGANIRQIQQFMRAKLDWIESAQNKVQRHVDNIVSLAPELYQQGAMIPYLGKQYKLEIKFSQNRQSSYYDSGTLGTLTTANLIHLFAIHLVRY
jgi:predicted metal-dependent hydrolase